MNSYKLPSHAFYQRLNLFLCYALFTYAGHTESGHTVHRCRSYSSPVQVIQFTGAGHTVHRCRSYSSPVQVIQFTCAGHTATHTESITDIMIITFTLYDIAKKCGNLYFFSQPEALKQLSALYVGRCFPCWKAPDVVAWLESNVKATLRLVDSGEKRVEEFAQK